MMDAKRKNLIGPIVSGRNLVEHISDLYAGEQHGLVWYSIPHGVVSIPPKSAGMDGHGLCMLDNCIERCLGKIRPWQCRLTTTV